MPAALPRARKDKLTRLVSEGELSREEIAKATGVALSTVDRYRARMKREAAAGAGASGEGSIPLALLAPPARKPYQRRSAAAVQSAAQSLTLTFQGVRITLSLEQA